ncbi:MAG: hypothetical protein LDL31_00875 [Prosthecobacter sp.]|jgi:hypothetical protein|nr:hypothetical protein [Prosthecobacter sp.]
MKDLIEQAAELQGLLEQQGWHFCFIGGIAIQRWSEPRLTKDMDITLLTGFGNEEPFIDFLLQRFESRIRDARSFALQNRILLLKTKEGTGIDVALGCLPFEEEAVRRSKLLEYVPGISLRTCSAEDLLVMKAFASRPIDWNDVRGILVRQGTKKLDWPYIRRQLQPLCELKEAPEIMTQLEKLHREVAASEPAA